MGSNLYSLLCGLASLPVAWAAAPSTHRPIPTAGSPPRTRAAPDLPLRLAVALSQSGVDTAAKQLMAVSDPDSPTYGQYWDLAQVIRAFAAPPRAVEAVLDWFMEVGVSEAQITKSHNVLYLNLTVAEAERIASSECYHTPNQDGTEAFITCEPYRLPHQLAEYIDYILPTHIPQVVPTIRRASPHKSARRQEHPRALNDQSCLSQTTPACLRQLYRIPRHSTSHPNNSFGIYQPSWTTWRDDDLDTFFDMFHPKLHGRRPVMMNINGGYRNLDAVASAFNLEPNLDLEYAMSLAYPMDVINIQVGSEESPGNLNVMLAAFDGTYCSSINREYDTTHDSDVLDCGTLQPPKVISISYAWNEIDFPREYLERQCLEFLKLGLQGVTVVVSSGDSGPAKHPDNTCLNPDTGIPYSGPGSFLPSSPASCPWVTVVGGTNLSVNESEPTGWRNQPSTGSPPAHVYEGVYSRDINNTTRTSGGGFSRLFAAPDYQADAVSQYLSAEGAHLESFRHWFNASNRGYPDVSVLATAYQVITGNERKSVYGTSASAPVFAAMIARINDARLEAGKAHVGFINPAMYKNHHVFNDVTSGANSGCGVQEAFRASKGWDAATGLGSPDYEKLREVFMAMP